MLAHRLKIVLSIVLSLALVQGITYFSENPLENTGQISKLFTFNLNPFNSSQTGLTNSGNSSFDLDKVPTAPLTEAVNNGATSQPELTSFSRKTPTPTVKKTATPTPTQKPKLTKAPAPTMMTIGAVRPGNSLYEIADIAQGATCAPAALILAFKSMETGQSFFNTSASTFKTYNTYEWWKTAGLSCGGYGYNTITGIVPSDAADAGVQCQNPVGNQAAGSQEIMGLMQFSRSIQDAYTDDFQRAFKVSTGVDRRVLFDAMVIAGFHFKNISLERSNDCQNWELKYVAKTACKYHGTCQYDYGGGNAGDYCQEVCEKYGEYGGPKLNCANAADTLKPGTCDFK